jgi:hypothetical protein
MKSLLFAFAFLAALGQSRPAAPKPTMMAVYKSPTCGCCSKWVEHMKQNGFTVNVTDLRDVSEIKTKHGVPSTAQSCHTAIVNGYVVEGHVPAADVKRMLKEKPAIAGLALPGMPQGSPGMEAPPNITPPPYEVLTFDKKGATRVYARHGGK